MTTKPLERFDEDLTLLPVSTETADCHMRRRRSDAVAVDIETVEPLTVVDKQDGGIHDRRPSKLTTKTPAVAAVVATRNRSTSRPTDRYLSSTGLTTSLQFIVNSCKYWSIIAETMHQHINCYTA
jgi:hypothetical protein